MSRRRTGRVCVLTGAIQRIGFSLAKRLGREGSKVAALDVSARRLEPAVADLSAKASKRAATMAPTFPTGSYQRSWLLTDVDPLARPD
jgi:3-oxoacyl-[acyl-carrier protein] reductase